MPHSATWYTDPRDPGSLVQKQFYIISKFSPIFAMHLEVWSKLVIKWSTTAYQLLGCGTGLCDMHLS